MDSSPLSHQGSPLLDFFVPGLLPVAPISVMALPFTNLVSHHYTIPFPIFSNQSFCFQNIVVSASKTLYLISSPLFVSPLHRDQAAMYMVQAVVIEQPYGRVPFPLKQCKFNIHHQCPLAGVSKVSCSNKSIL